MQSFTLAQIAQYQALFALLGITYGGDGQTTFGLPDLRGRLAVGQGGAPGLPIYTMGETAGTEAVTLTTQTMPAHNPQFVSTAAPSLDAPANAVLATPTAGALLYTSAGPNGTLNAAANGATVGGQPHPNIMPYLCVSFIIALNGIFPTRN